MSKIRTSTLLIAGVVCFLLSGLVRVGVVCLRPVKDASGAQLFRPDGRMLMESDAWGDIKVNWLSDLMLLICAAVFLWCFVRFVRSRVGGTRAS